MGLFGFLHGTDRPAGLVLALGGGGARGIAHVGVLSVLEEEQIPVAAIAGTSAGAIVGAMWLTLKSSSAVLSRWREMVAAGLLPTSVNEARVTAVVSPHENMFMQLANRIRHGATVAFALQRRSILAAEALSNAINFLIPDVLIEDLPSPYAAVATDFATGQAVAITRGSLRLALVASSSIPGVVPPRRVGSRAFFDGGVVADTPVAQARALLRRPVVAIDVGEVFGGASPDDVTVEDALIRASLMTHQKLRELLIHGSDLVLSPRVGSMHWADFHLLEEAFDAGRTAARDHLAQLSSLARRGGWRGIHARLAVPAPKMTSTQP